MDNATAPCDSDAIPRNRALRRSLVECLLMKKNLEDRLVPAKTAVELEVRLGRMDADGNFVAGVRADAQAERIDFMAAFDDWDAAHDWTETTDYFFEVAGRPLRQSARIDADEFAMVCDPAVEKRTWLSFLFVVGDDRAIKISVATEQRVDDVPRLVQPTWVRRKYRRSFQMEETRFDFTIVREGQNKCALGEPRYEHEIEVVGPTDQVDVDAILHAIQESLRTREADPVGPFVLASRRVFNSSK